METHLFAPEPPRVLKLTCTASALACGFTEKIHKWKDEERDRLRAELDAAYFHLYGFAREDVDYFLSTFQGIVKEDHAHAGIGKTRRQILDLYDDYAAKMNS